MKSLLYELIKLLIKICKKTLSGIYLHGSLAMNGFNKRQASGYSECSEEFNENKGETDAIKLAQIIEIRVAGYIFAVFSHI
jgi:hypothetical protein